MSDAKTGTQPYQVIKTEAEFEIRLYPSATIALIKSTTNTYKELSSSGFRKLAGYIFGGNDAQQSISMTTPVHMDIRSDTSTMAFVMPSNFTKENLPKPNDSDVIIQQTKEEYVAAIRFGGYASDAEIRSYSEKLENALNKAGVGHADNYRFLGYNAPYQVAGRRNEIIVEVVWNVE